MTPQDQKPCGFCQNAKTALNLLGVVVLALSAFAYDTSPMPLWVGALDLCICALFVVQVLPPVEVEA